MRIRIVQKPALDSIDGLQLDRYELGYTYDLGNTIGALFLAEGWGEPVSEDPSAPAEAAAKIEPAPPPYDPDNPPNLRREVYPPYLDRLDLDIAADLDRLRRAARTERPSDSGRGGHRRRGDPPAK